MTSANTMSILKGANRLDARRTPALRNWIGYAAAVIARIKALAPYALIELVIPGGSVMALLLWLYRRRKNRVDFAPLRMKLLGVPPSDTAGCAVVERIQIGTFDTTRKLAPNLTRG